MVSDRGRFWVDRKDRPRKLEGQADRAVVLCRQSLSRAGSISLADQELHGRRWCETQGYAVVDVLHSPNVRGWQDDRRDHQAVLALAQAGKIDVVVAYDVARAARTMRIMESWAGDLEQLGVRLEFASAPMANTPMGRQMLTMLAEMETQQRSVRMQDLFEDMMGRRGWWHGNVPFGYRRHEKSLEIDDDHAPLVRGMFARAADGWGSGRIAAWLNAEGALTQGGAPWDRDAVRTVLKNPAYLGHVHRHGEVVHEGAHPAIIPPDVWEQVRAHDGTQGLPHKRHAAHWLEGLVVHACGARCYRRVWRRAGRPGGGWSFDCSSVARPGPICGVRPTTKSGPMVEGAARVAIGAAFGVAVPVEVALAQAEALAGGSDVSRDRRKVERALAKLTDREERALGFALSGRMRVARLDQERDAIAIERQRLTLELSALPAAPDVGALTAAASLMATMAEAGDYAEGDDLRAVLTHLGVIEVGATGVRLVLLPHLATLIPDAPIVPYPPRAAYGSQTA